MALCLAFTVPALDPPIGRDMCDKTETAAKGTPGTVDRGDEPTHETFSGEDSLAHCTSDLCSCPEQALAAPWHDAGTINWTLIDA